MPTHNAQHPNDPGRHEPPHRVVHDLWCCPRCRGDLAVDSDAIHCLECKNQYPVIAGIPDLRVTHDAWIDFEADRESARETHAHIQAHGLKSAIENVFSSSRKFSLEKARLRTAQVYAGIDKCESQIGEWLSPFIVPRSLEIGSGPGQLLAAVARHGGTMAGMDVSMEWLVVSKHMVAENGGHAILAAGLAEHVPVRNGAVQSIVSLDVIEHVSDQTAFAREISRILAPDGLFAVSTPNRFSLSPEPHVGVWGVGYLPVRFQRAWVKFVSGQEYAYTRLLSRTEALRLFAPDKAIKAQVAFPHIDPEDMALFSRPKARLAAIYNWLVGIPVVQLVLPLFGAYYRLTGRKTKDFDAISTNDEGEPE